MYNINNYRSFVILYGRLLFSFVNYFIDYFCSIILFK